MSAKRNEHVVPLFDQIVFAPDRESIPGARRVISFDEEDESEYLASIEEVASLKAHLRRRDREHGAWAELDLSASGVDPLRQRPSPELLAERWEAARPILLPGAFAQFPESEVETGLDLGRRLAKEGELRGWLESKAKALPEGCEAPRLDRSTDERVIEKCLLPRTEGPDLWLMSAWLSDPANDPSLRLRVSLGREVEDDASTDEASQRAVTRLAEALVPGALRVDLDPHLMGTLASLVGGEPYLTQHIAYWNAPNGGALMHHDAFDAPENGGQRAVVYTQLAGTTAWLALSIDDLASRLEDYCEFLDEGGADWVRKALWPERHDFERVQARLRDRRASLNELALPGCGKFGPLVNHGPEFTSFLADAGHAVFVRPGDTLLMPSHGLDRCVMHSVFCASEGETYSISAALRTSVDAGKR